MFSISVRFDKRRLSAVLLLTALVGAGAFCAKEALWSSSISTESRATPRRVDTAAANEQQRRDFMAAYGWEVSEEPIEVRSILIPSEFNEEYEKYNYIQKQQGFDLSRHRGRECRRYVYEILNYPGGVQDARITLLVYKDRIIGGDISSSSADGFMHGFDSSASVWLGLPGESQSTFAPEE